jgi:hypothetical protein
MPSVGTTYEARAVSQVQLQLFPVLIVCAKPEQVPNDVLRCNGKSLRRFGVLVCTINEWLDVRHKLAKKCVCVCMYIYVNNLYKYCKTGTDAARPKKLLYTLAAGILWMETKHIIIHTLLTPELRELHHVLKSPKMQNLNNTGNVCPT